MNIQNDGTVPSPTQPKPRPLYRLERRESGKLLIFADGLTYVQSLDICNRVAGLHIRFSYNASSEVVS